MFLPGKETFAPLEAAKPEEKDAVRKAVRERRRGISPDARAEWESCIRNRVRNILEQIGADTILSYISIPEEVDTRVLLTDWLAEGNNVLAPAVTADKALTWHPLTQLESLKPGAYGIPEPPEPSTPRPFDPQTPVLVPCLAFNDQCHRIGYGGGYFDRFLAAHKGISIGLAFECQRFDFLREPHDVPVNSVVTEKRVYEGTRQGRPRVRAR